MNRKFSFLRLSFPVAGLLFISLISAKCKHECEDIICDPCPNSRLRVEYVDSAGHCLVGLQNSAMVYGLSTTSGDTLFSYTVSDSCNATFLIQDHVEYHFVAGAFRDTISLKPGWEYQAGMEVSECCLCYPVKNADVIFGKDTTHVDWPVGEYENVPVTRTIF